MRKPKDGRKKKVRPNTSTSTDNSGDESGASKERGSALASIFISAERVGNIREFLEAATLSTRKLEAESNKRESASARRAEEIREAISLYVHSLVGGLDACTKQKIICDLILDCRVSASQEWRQKSKDHKMELASEDDAAFSILLAFRDVADAYCAIAKEGEENLVGELPIYAAQLVECLNGIAQTRPDLVQDIAGEMVTWPIMASKNYPKRSDFDKLAERIGLSRGSTVNPHRAQKWKPDTPINKFLLDFFGGLVLTDQDSYFRKAGADWPKLTPQTLPYWLDEIIMPSLDHIREKEGSWNGIKVLSKILDRIPYEAEHRKYIRNRIKAALEGMARGVNDSA